ncbi:hypothetical protein AAF712_013714 [Marasmius tenuissimus]|uniref:Uncharacterized protein n=1 Tax=Marasmius tenuissimus TaxID=585030 RepID=A0ABR2ZFJ1_9AGAR
MAFPSQDSDEMPELVPATEQRRVFDLFRNRYGSPNRSMPSRLQEIKEKLNVGYHHAKFRFIDELFLFVIHRPILMSNSPYATDWSSRDNGSQRIHPLESFHFSDLSNGCSPDEIAHGVVDCLLNLHKFIHQTPNNPALVGFAYTGFTPQLFSIPFDYKFSRDFSSPQRFSFRVYRRDHVATWLEVSDYKVGCYRAGNPDTPLLDFTPDRFKTDVYPMIPAVWHSFTSPFTVTALPGSPEQFALVHKDTNLLVATKHAPKLFMAAVEAMVASEGRRVLDGLSPEDLVAHVQDATDRWFMDGTIVAEYFLNFKHILFYDVLPRYHRYTDDP